MKKIGVGIVGYGFSSVTFHIPLLQTIEEYEIRAIVSSKREQVQENLPHVEVLATVEELVQKENIDLVIITSPNTTHYSYAKQAIEHKKHVVVEKPFVISSEEGEELLQLVKEQQVVLSVYHNRRWDNDFLTIQKLIREGQLGSIYTYEAHFDRFRPHVRDRWREHNLPGSGMLYDLGSHLIDQALHLFGKPKTVFADVVMQRQGAQTDDYFHIVLGYDKLRVLLHSSSFIKIQGPRFSVHGEKGSIIKYGIDSQEEQLKQGLKPGDKRFGEDTKEHYAMLSVEEHGETITSIIPTERGNYQAYYRGIHNSIIYHTEPPVSAEDGLHVIQVIEACLASGREQRVISL
ncbi:oxidoreductase [Microbacteriaceae bacterium 4G12]